MYTGRDALSSIEQAISQVRSDEGRLDAALGSAIDEAARLRRQEAEALQALARVKLDAAMSEKVIEHLGATERRAREMLDKHRLEIEELGERRDAAQAALEQAERTKHDRNQDLATVLEKLDNLRNRTLEQIKPASDWRAATEAFEAAKKIAENAEQKAAQAEADLIAKGKPYEDDPLFIYLWRKKHGQPEDTSGSFVRYFDRKIAELVGYQGARANYAMLQEIPLRLREHAKNKQSDVEGARQRQADIERRAMVAAGIEAIEKEADASQTAMKAAADGVTKVTGELQQIESRRQSVHDSGENAVEKNAIDLLTDSLARADMHKLLQEASRTETTADDEAVATISKVRSALAKTDGEVTQIRSEIREAARRRTELEGARDRARNVGYDDPRGHFGGNGGEIVGQVIGGIVGGILQGGALDRVLRDNHRASSGGGESGSSSSQGSSTNDGGGWRTGGSF